MIKLLTVDDEVAIRLILEAFFHKKYDVVSARNGKEAIKWIRDGGTPDIIIADLNMPELDGTMFIQEVRALPSTAAIPIIVLSSEPGSLKKIECLRLGADDYLVKPFNPEELEVRIDKLLNLINSTS